MTTQEFINKAWYGNTRKRFCSSVFKDNRGNLYSYGYHYPLLFRLNGVAIRNTSGYSTSTNRHISWTRDIEAVDVKVPYSFRLSDYRSEVEQLRELAVAQYDYADDIRQRMDAKKRKDTQVYAYLQHQYDRAMDSWHQLKQAIEA